MTPPWAAHLPAGMAHEQVDLLHEGTLPQAWRRRWAGDAGRIAVIDDGGRLTAGALEEASRAVAGRLAGAGLHRGDRILMSAAASTALVTAHVAALRLGLVVVPVNTGYTEREVAQVVRDAAPAAAIVDDRGRAGWVERASAPRHVIVTTPDVPLAGSSPPALDAVAPRDPALLVYTSGTTGTPKGALLSHGNLLAGAEAVRLAWRWEPDDRLVLPLPLFHLHGLGVGVHGTLAAGATMVLRRGFDPGDVLDALGRHGATLLFGVPTMWARLAASPRVGELAALRLCVSGSAPLPASLHAVVARDGGQVVLERYGMTETVMTVSNPHDGPRRAGTVGLPLPGVDVLLDDGTAEILVRGPNVFAGYRNRPEATAAAFVDGWFRTGDVGAHDADGYLRIVGRLRELIISGGYNVYPREVEDVLREHPGVTDAAVVGIPHPDWGEQVIAYVEGDAAPSEVIAFASSRLAPFKRPREVRTVDSLPRTALGKVRKELLTGRPVEPGGSPPTGAS